MAKGLFRSLMAAGIVGLWAAPAVATDDSTSRPQNGFDWFANAAAPASNAEAIARTRAAIMKARGLSKGANWICSPAGSGKKAACHKG
jgi:hypothetical protein